MGAVENTKGGTASPVAEEAAEVGSIRELKSLHTDGIDPVFEHQARLVNHAVQVIGMGKVERTHRITVSGVLTCDSTNGHCSSSADTVGCVTR